MVSEEAVVTSIILSLLVDFSKKVLAGNAKLTIKKIKDNATHVVSRFVISLSSNNIGLFNCQLVSFNTLRI